MGKSTLIIGASTNPSRYAWLAAERLLQNEHPVYPFGIKAGNTAGIDIITDWDTLPDIVDTVTLYIRPSFQSDYLDAILRLNPKRIIFNPGTESAESAAFFKQHGIETLNACTLVMLSNGLY